MEDLISRQAAIAVADSTDYVGLSVEDVKKVTDEVIKELKKLPSAQGCQCEPPKQKHGKWFNTTTDIPNLLMNVCSECGFQYPHAIRPRFNYCPNCGARMEERI